VEQGGLDGLYLVFSREVPLIVATPGRLLDHLRNTTSLDVGRLQWLVLDEADRLLQLGFEQTLSDIMKAIDGRRRATCEAQRERMIKEFGSQHQGQIADKDVMDTFGEYWWKHPRRTILCSATLDEGVQVLAGKTLSNPRVIRGDPEKDSAGMDVDASTQMTTMTAPAQLKQNYIVMPTKQRLVVLIALLRQAVSSGKSKVMVFLSCTDSVDFHWSALGGVKMTASEEEAKTPAAERESPLRKESDLLPSTSVFKLHGSLTQHERQASLKLFSQCKQSAVLLCTSVASRGLDLDISLVVLPPRKV
jgi:ATP-dependent RNA helicase DDX31/DBP7